MDGPSENRILVALSSTQKIFMQGKLNEENHPRQVNLKNNLALA